MPNMYKIYSTYKWIRDYCGAARQLTQEESHGAPTPEVKHNTAAVCPKKPTRPAAEELALPKGKKFLHEGTFHLTVETAKQRHIMRAQR